MGPDQREATLWPRYCRKQYRTRCGERFSARASIATATISLVFILAAAVMVAAFSVGDDTSSTSSWRWRTCPGYFFWRRC